MLVAFSVSVSFGSHEIPKSDVVKVEKSIVSVNVVDAYKLNVDLGVTNFSSQHSPHIISFIELPNITTKTVGLGIPERLWRYGIIYKESIRLNNKPIHSMSYSICARHKC